jgi:hypothetical protein
MAGVALFWLGFKVFVGALGNIPWALLAPGRPIRALVSDGSVAVRF